MQYYEAQLIRGESNFTPPTLAGSNNATRTCAQTKYRIIIQSGPSAAVINTRDHKGALLGNALRGA